MTRAKQSELHPDDEIDLEALVLTCGQCGRPLERGDWQETGFDGQRYTVYPYTCPTPTCPSITLSVPQLGTGKRRRAVSEGTINALELKSDAYLQPVRRSRKQRRTRFDYAREHRADIEVTVELPTVA